MYSRATVSFSNGSGKISYGDFSAVVSGGNPPAFVPVTNISGVPDTATAGTPLTLSGTVEPANATNKTITWAVTNAGGTGAAISGNSLTSAAAGTVTVTATIANGLTASSPYTQDFAIAVSAAPPVFIPVTNISGLPSTVVAGTPLALSGTVEPANATNKTIIWTVANAGGTGAVISGGTLTTPAAGEVSVRAAITNGLATGDYTQPFTITVSGGDDGGGGGGGGGGGVPPAFVPVSNITGVSGTAAVGTPLTLTGTVIPANATNKTIVWTVANAGGTGAVISGSTLITTAAGTVIVTARIANGLATGDYTRPFAITVSEYVPVPPGDNLNITVGFNLGVEITGSNGTNVIRKTGYESLTLSATGYTSVVWYVDGGVANTGNTLTINAGTYATQIHSVTFTGYRNGTPYSQAIPFTVSD
jgi:endo-1,4-beta-xylanase